MNQKEFLEAVDCIYKKSLEDNSELLWSKVTDALSVLMLQYKEGYNVRDWKSILED